MKKSIILLTMLFMSLQSFALTNTQKSDLLFMYQEEKLAHDVYVSLSKSYNLKVFNNISKSEAIHMGEIKTLLDTYKIKVPILKDGEFADKNLQDLYIKLTKEGKTSINNALNVGIIIEDKDIADLKLKMKDTPNDIKLVYQNLLQGSEKHKKAFSKFN